MASGTKVLWLEDVVVLKVDEAAPHFTTDNNVSKD